MVSRGLNFKMIDRPCTNTRFGNLCSINYKKLLPEEKEALEKRAVCNTVKTMSRKSILKEGEKLFKRIQSLVQWTICEVHKPFPTTSLENLKPFPTASLENLKPFPTASLENLKPFPTASLKPFPTASLENLKPFPTASLENLKLNYTQYYLEILVLKTFL